MTKTALILSGGGARAAYQVGVLKALGELFPDTKQSPFSIVCGTSAGAINAAKIASHADEFHEAISGLESIWSNLTSADVHRIGYYRMIKSVVKIFVSFFHSGIAKGQPISLFDNRPLFYLLKRSIDFRRLNTMISNEHLHALSINALGYTSGQNIAFFQGHESIQSWTNARRLGLRTPLRHKHLMASSAIPAVFPAVHIHREFFGDGAVRQSAPLSAALKLGADKLFVVGVSGNTSNEQTRTTTTHSPSIAQTFGHMINSAFIDALDEDITMLDRFTTFAHAMGKEKQAELGIKPVEVLVIKPTIQFDKLANDLEHLLPKSVRVLLSIVGANKKGDGSSLASYLLFEKAYCQALIDCGYDDAMKQSQEILDFMKNTQ